MADPAPVEILARALDQATRLVSSVRPDQLEGATPCSGWTVRDLLRHMVGGTVSFRGMLEGGPMGRIEATVDDEQLDASYRDGAAALIAAWRENGALDRTMTMFGGEVPAVVPLNLQLTETAVHSWDLATSIGHGGELDDEVAEGALAFAEANLGPDRRGQSFGPPLEASPGAGAYERLAAFTGRQSR